VTLTKSGVMLKLPSSSLTATIAAAGSLFTKQENSVKLR